MLGKRFLLLDRDPLYTQAFRRILDQAGVKTVRLPAHSPNLKGFASYCTSFVLFAAIWKTAPLFELATL